jgi:hypothetical protein
VNLFGVDVSALDVDAFLGVARVMFPVLALGWLALLLRVRRPGWLFAGVLFANAFVWLETNWPLQRLYALGPSSDRLNNLAMTQAVAAGGSFLHTAQVGHLQFEPLWAALTATLSAFDPARHLQLYAFYPLVMAWGFALSLYAATRLRPPAPEWSPWERVMIAGFATLLSSAALDWASPYRVPWPMTFLLKPNHAVGLVITPWVVWAIANARRGRDRLLAGLLLNLLGWAFVIHMGAVCVGLVSYALLVTGWHREEARAAWRDVGVAIGVNVLVVSPYLFMLFNGYGVFQSGPRLEIPPASPHLLEVTTRMAWLTALAGWGMVILFRRDRLGRVWCGQAVGALLLWLSYYPLHFLQQAKERDDVFYWVRFNLAICAAVGAWELAGRAARRWPRLGDAAVRAAVLTVALIPAALPSWWDPSRMDLYFAASLPPVPARYTEPAAVLAKDRRAVLAGDPAASRWMAALTGTRVLLALDFPAPRDWTTRVAYARALVRGELADPRGEGARWGVTHLIVTPAFLAANGVTLTDLQSRPDLRTAVLAGDPRGDFVALFTLASPQS